MIIKKENGKYEIIPESLQKFKKLILENDIYLITTVETDSEEMQVKELFGQFKNIGLNSEVLFFLFIHFAYLFKENSFL